MSIPETDPATAELLQSLIHELKGPANRLRLLSELLRRDSGGLNEDGRKLLGHIEDSAASVRAVADGVRAYSELCTRPLRREPLDLNAALDWAIAGLAREIAEAGARVTRDALPVVSADRDGITWVFRELLANALRNRTPGQALLVEVRAVSMAECGACISVADTGRGIEADMRERIFRPFHKGGPGGGAGMGLTICRRIVGRHGGRIWVEERAEGAEVRFSIGTAK